MKVAMVRADIDPISFLLRYDEIDNERGPFIPTSLIFLTEKNNPKISFECKNFPNVPFNGEESIGEGVFVLDWDDARSLTERRTLIRSHGKQMQLKEWHEDMKASNRCHIYGVEIHCGCPQTVKQE